MKNWVAEGIASDVNDFNRQSAGINLQSPQSDLSPWTLTLKSGVRFEIWILLFFRASFGLSNLEGWMENLKF